jgi:N-acylneuraminate cytidylyltransferase
VVLYATAPLRTADDIGATVALLAPEACDFALAVSEYDSPPHQALALNDDHRVTPKWPDLVERRADEIGPLVVDNGSTYAVDVSAFREHQSFYGPGLRGHLMPRERSVDIDTPLDFDLALFFAGRLETAA